MSPVGILLAAGRGRRFDPSGAHNKLLVRLGDDAVVAASARALLSTLSHVVAVVPPDDGGVGAVLPVDLHIGGCPPSPISLLKGLLALLERVDTENATSVA